MSEKTLLVEIRDLYSSNNCEDVIEKSIRRVYKILTSSDINSAFKNFFEKNVDIPIHKIFKDRIEYFPTDYIDTLTNAYAILFILIKYLRYLEKDSSTHNIVHSGCTVLFTIFEFIKENGISSQASEDCYNLIVPYDNLDNMTLKDIKLNFLERCGVKHSTDAIKIINGERTAEQRDMLNLNVDSTDKHVSSMFSKIRCRLSKISFITKLVLLLCVFVILGCVVSTQFALILGCVVSPQLTPIIGLAICAIASMNKTNKDLAKNSHGEASQIEDLAQNSPAAAEASYNTISYVNIQLLLDKIERNIQKGYKFRNINIARYKNIYFKEIVNNCKVENLPETTIDGYVKILNSLLNDMYNAKLENAISESNATLTTLQSLTRIDGIQKDSIQGFCVNLKSH